MRQLDKGARRASSRRAAQGECSLQRLIVLAVYLRSQQSMKLAAQCWCSERRHRGCVSEDTSLERALTVVKSWVDVTTPAIWQELQHPERAASQKAVARAQTFLADAFTAVWAFTNNVNKGHAPTTQQLFIHSSSTGTVAQLSDAAERSAAVSASTPRMWAWRWRRRWFFKYGKIRTREQYDVEELRRKVRSRVSPKSAFLFHKIVPTFGVKK